MEFVYITHPSQIREMARDGNTYEKARKHLIERFGFDYDSFPLEIDGAGMWRQFFGIHFENAVVEVLCRLNDFERCDITYLGDGFSTRNPFKVSLVKIKVLNPEERGANLQIYRLSESYFENQVMEDIDVFDGIEKAHIFHQRLKKKMGYSCRSKDISDLLSEFTKHGLSSMKRDEAVDVFRKLFVVKEQGKIKIRRRFTFDRKKGVYTSKDGKDELAFPEMVDMAERNSVLPASETYYSEFFFFIPGILEPEFVQIEAEFETADPEIYKPALTGFWRAKEIAGRFPSLISIPDFNVRYEFRFTKTPGCVCLCMSADEMLDSAAHLEKTDLTFYELSHEIGKILVQHAIS